MLRSILDRHSLEVENRGIENDKHIIIQVLNFNTSTV